MLLADTVSLPTMVVGVVAAVIAIGLIAVWYLRNPNMFK